MSPIFEITDDHCAALSWKSLESVRLYRPPHSLHHSCKHASKLQLCTEVTTYWSAGLSVGGDQLQPSIYGVFSFILFQTHILYIHSPWQCASFWVTSLPVEICVPYGRVG
jgi:hypothetical protein